MYNLTPRKKKDDDDKNDSGDEFVPRFQLPPDDDEIEDPLHPGMTAREKYYPVQPTEELREEMTQQPLEPVEELRDEVVATPMQPVQQLREELTATPMQSTIRPRAVRTDTALPAETEDTNYGYGRVMPTETETSETALPNSNEPNYDPNTLPAEFRADPTLTRPKNLPFTSAQALDRLNAYRNELQNSPIQNKRGRFLSGLSAMMMRFGKTLSGRPIRDWNDLAQGLADGAVYGVGGMFDKKLDDRMIRETQLEDTDREIAGAQGAYNADLSNRTKEAQIDILKQKPLTETTKLRQKDYDLYLRESRQNFQQLDSSQKTTLSAIFKRGYYLEGQNAAEDEQLAKLGIVLPDFDSRKREIREQGGKYFERNPATNNWEESKGIPVDASEVPVEYSVGGKRLMMRPRDIATLEGAKERQVSQQQFTLKRDGIAQQMRLQLEEVKRINALEAKETDAAIKKDLQTQAENVRKELARLKGELIAADSEQE